MREAGAEPRVNRNVEIKARVEDLKALEKRVREIADGNPAIMHQEDSFFRIESGRLKLRKLSDTRGELIFYTRPDSVLPAESCYSLFSTAAPGDLFGVLSQALGVRGVVRKRRSLYLIGQTRVHLDRVEGLGSFMELEVVLEPDQDPDEGVAVAHELMGELGIPEDALVEHAYIDLLEDRQEEIT